MYTPKGCGFLWASPEFQARVMPPVLSSESGGDYDEAALGMPFAERRGFTYVGTRDYTNWAAVPAAFEFRRGLPGGEEACMEYGTALAMCKRNFPARSHILGDRPLVARAGTGRRLAELWGTEVMAMSESHPSWISTIRVPDFSSPEEEAFVRSQLSERFRTNASWVEWGGATWMRFSAQIYLDRETLDEYGRRVLALRDEYRAAQEEEVAAEGEDRARL